VNKNNAADYLPLVQALADGKTIQFCYNEVDWADDPTPAFGAWPADRFRIKPEPREIWVNRYSDGVDGQPYRTREEAVRMAESTAVQVCYREVIE